MNNDNRLIYIFKRQTRNSIFKLMTNLGTDAGVSSMFLDKFEEELEVNDVYLYATGTNVVMVCLDHFGGDEELADEELYGHEKPLYFTQCTHRVSPVWKLSNAMKVADARLRKLDGCPVSLEKGTLHGVLVTDSSLLNADDIREVWRDMNIKVIDSVSDVRHLNFQTNPDSDELGKEYIQAIATGTEGVEIYRKKEEKPEKEEDADEEFTRMLNEFINSESRKTHDDNDDDNDDDNALLSDEELSPSDDELFPSDEVQQNGNLSVKVEILRPIAHPREELEKLVGCEDIKRRMDELLALVRYNRQMNELFPDSKQHEVSLHSLFLGCPGTGKTTVCKIFGSLLREAGVLSKGHVVLANRSTFIGTLWGDEERSVNQLIEKAQGGVLMIDEAYLLDSGNEKDPGRLVIQLLMNILADESQRDIAVVLCGYREPMLKLLDTNPGLHSRFPNKFEFADFTVDELLKITRRRIEEYQYRFTRSAWIKYRGVLDAAYQMRDPKTWGNARFVANQLENIYIRHATRCISHPPRDKRRMRVLTPADIQPIEVPRPKSRLGFC